MNKIKIRVTYSNYANYSEPSRLDKDLKNLYWQEGKEPEDWFYFDGEIETKQVQSRGGDCFEVEISESYNENWVLEHLKKTTGVRFIEKWGVNDYHFEEWITVFNIKNNFKYMNERTTKILR